MSYDDEIDAFLAMIKSGPENDANRLVYADFLEDHGEYYHANLVRAQVALFREFGLEGCINPNYDFFNRKHSRLYNDVVTASMFFNLVCDSIRGAYLKLMRGTFSHLVINNFSSWFSYHKIYRQNYHLEFVEIKNCYPNKTADTSLLNLFFFQSFGSPMSAFVPKEILDLMEGHCPVESTFNRKNFSTDVAARISLSKAMLKWSDQKIGGK